MASESQRSKSAKALSLRGIFDVVGVLMGAAAAAGFLGAWWWGFDACSHFRVQYFFGFLAIGIFFGFRREKTKSGLAAAGALINFLVVLPHLLAPNPQAPTFGDQAKLRVLWWNVHSSNENVRSFLDLVGEESPDLIALAEVNADWQCSLAVLQESYPYCRVEAREDNFGMALYARRPLRSGQTLRHEPNGVPMLQAEIMFDGRVLCLLAVHPLPPAGYRRTRARNQQLIWLSRHVNRMNRPAVIVGDLNTTPWNHAFKRLVGNSRLRSHPSGFSPTWPATFPPLAIPLDHCLATPEVRIVRKRIGPSLGSDHKSLIVDLVWSAENGLENKD